MYAGQAWMCHYLEAPPGPYLWSPISGVPSLEPYLWNTTSGPLLSLHHVHYWLHTNADCPERENNVDFTALMFINIAADETGWASKNMSVNDSLPKEVACAAWRWPEHAVPFSLIRMPHQWGIAVRRRWLLPLELDRYCQLSLTCTSHHCRPRAWVCLLLCILKQPLKQNHDPARRDECGHAHLHTAEVERAA